MDFFDFSSYDWDTWTTFLEENWLILLIALIALFLVIRIVKTIIKWAIVAIIVIGIVLYSGYTLEDVKEIGSKVMDTSIDELKELGSKVSESVKQEAVNAMMGEAQDAQYTLEKDGAYMVETKNVKLKGEVGADEVYVSVHGAPYIMLQLDETIMAFIEQSKSNS
ncbi:hypothetical protein [Paenibacillus chungangensis]|uniref:ATPase n=1 Tax=Paenibacillus chungangensis TaxID=696535 RepID=A0ABW3HSD6_9BACL